MIMKVGITGGIGSGKSTVAKVFEELGIPVYYADAAAKKLMNEDELLVAQIQKEFGEASYVDGKLDRKYLAALVFNNEKKLAMLNSIVHPATLRDSDEWMLQQTTPYALKEAALIFESGANKQLDCVIGVYAPAPLRQQRILERDHATVEEIKARMENQMDEEEKMRLCDYIITNDEQELVVPQVIQIHQELIAKKSPKPFF